MRRFRSTRKRLKIQLEKRGLHKMVSLDLPSSTIKFMLKSSKKGSDLVNTKKSL